MKKAQPFDRALVPSRTSVILPVLEDEALPDQEGSFTFNWPPLSGVAIIRNPSGSCGFTGYDFNINDFSKALGLGERWITVTPPGHDKGVPILIKEHPDGTASVIGGAG
ncbi:MAG: hypothetical protein VB032_06340 [Burkholderiaceae bacterium]|nr:hypothetical protein [Burkholderiaceae bacterium]